MPMDVIFGRMHPLVIHFPIALILLAAAIEVIRIKWDRPYLSQMTLFLLLAGALGALAASATGWVFSHEYYPPPSEQWMLERHRWLGISTAVLAGMASVAAYRWAGVSTGITLWLRRGIIWLTALAVTVTAHLGALMVWGAVYFQFGTP